MIQTTNIWQLVYDAHCLDTETNLHQTRVHWHSSKYIYIRQLT